VQHRDLNALMALGGWKTPAMVFRYAHANVDQFQASIDALPTTARELGASVVHAETAKGKTA